MSKKHFIALADCLRATKPQPETDQDSDQSEYLAALSQWEFMVRRVSGFCSDQNPRFNYQRFVDYINGECGPCGGRVKGGAA